MPVTHDLCARGETYTDRDGNEKSRWVKCGVIIEKDGRLSVKIESLPVAFDGWLSAFEPKEKQPARPARQSRAAELDGEDIPF